jgi:hypothetical protein
MVQQPLQSFDRPLMRVPLSNLIISTRGSFSPIYPFILLFLLYRFFIYHYEYLFLYIFLQDLMITLSHSFKHLYHLLPLFTFTECYIPFQFQV